MSDNPKIAVLESEVRNINQDVNEIKHDVATIRQTNVSIEKSLSKLTVIAESNQKLEPRVSAIEKHIYKIYGGIAALIGAIGILRQLGFFN